MNMRQRVTLTLMLLSTLFLMMACGSETNQIKPKQTVTIDQSFQSQLTPLPTVPAYRCGAWSSNNVPGSYSTISIYAKLVKNASGVSGAPAQAIVHFQNFDFTLDQRPVSDEGGYVTFTLALQGRQPRMVPTTIDVSFQTGGKTVECTPAFFTPQ